MKILKLRNLLFGLMAVLAIAILMTACEQGSINPPIQVGTDENQKIMDALCNDVHDCSNVEILEDAIIFDKCMHIDKDDMLKYLAMLENGIEQEPVMSTIPHPLDPDKMIEIQDNGEQNNATIEERQRIVASSLFAKNTEVTNLKYYIHQSARDCHANNENAINEATGYWSSISNCRVKFSYTSNINSADIIFGCDDDPLYRALSGHGYVPWNWLAQADIPDYFSRKVGRFISINDTYTSNTSLRKGVMIHEIGHCLGLDHTDETFGHLLEGSPETDDNSLMNATDANRNEFSNEDLKMVRRLWPQSLSQPTNVSLTKVGRKVRIKFKNPNRTTGPYDNFRVYHLYAGGSGNILVENSFIQANAHGNYEILVPESRHFASGRHYFTIQGRSRGGEITSPWTNWKYVDM